MSKCGILTCAVEKMDLKYLDEMAAWGKKRVLITGNTGFKGSWLSILLHHCGAEVYGFALKPNTNPSLFELANLSQKVSQTYGDINNINEVKETIMRSKPEVIFHLAAQPLVRESYKRPVQTFATNIMGTVNLYEIAREFSYSKCILNVTTDKCYQNNEWHWGYRETDPLGGFDPYSASKGCVELIRPYTQVIFQ